jgi:hypothetical protein
VIEAHVSPDLIISGLRLLMEGYKLARDRFKDRKTPDRVEEIVVRAEKTPPISKAEIEQSITDALDPGDATIVKGDLERLGLLMLQPPSLDAFDYWGKLTKLAAGLQAYAKKNRLFELRGDNKPKVGEVLLLPRSGRFILPNKHAVELAASSHHMEGVKDAECLALLQKDTQEFAIVTLVGARFNEYSAMGGPPGVRSDACYFYLAPGQQRHWLRFARRESASHFIQRYEYRLEASNLIAIAQALRDDIRDYAVAVQADEQKIGPLFASVDAFAKGIAD